MKTKYLLLMGCLLVCSMAFAQHNTFKSLFDKYEKEDNVTIVSISKAMFNLIPGNINTGNVDLRSVVPKIESLLIITSEKKDMKTKMYADFKTLVDNNKDYEELMRVKSDKTNVTFNARKKGNIIHELVMLVHGEEDFVAIQILGNFTIEEIQKIAQDTQIQTQ